MKFDVLGVPEGPVVSADAAEANGDWRAEITRRRRGTQRDRRRRARRTRQSSRGDGFVGLDLGDRVENVALRLPGDRPRVRAYSAISALDVLRRNLERT